LYRVGVYVIIDKHRFYRWATIISEILGYKRRQYPLTNARAHIIYNIYLMYVLQVHWIESINCQCRWICQVVTSMYERIKLASTRIYYIHIPHIMCVLYWKRYICQCRWFWHAFTPMIQAKSRVSQEKFTLRKKKMIPIGKTNLFSITTFQNHFHFECHWKLVEKHFSDMAEKFNTSLCNI